jgi:hypothetical protein
MDKKTALLTLLENSFWISDTDKRNILLKIDTLTDAQIDQLGKFLVEERDIMIQDKDKILNNSNSLLKIVRESLKQLQ